MPLFVRAHFLALARGKTLFRTINNVKNLADETIRISNKQFSTDKSWKENVQGMRAVAEQELRNLIGKAARSIEWRAPPRPDAARLPQRTPPQLMRLSPVSIDRNLPLRTQRPEMVETVTIDRPNKRAGLTGPMPRPGYPSSPTPQSRPGMYTPYGPGGARYPNNVIGGSMNAFGVKMAAPAPTVPGHGSHTMRQSQVGQAPYPAGFPIEAAPLHLRPYERVRIHGNDNGNLTLSNMKVGDLAPKISWFPPERPEDKTNFSNAFNRNLLDEIDWAPVNNPRKLPGFHDATPWAELTAHSSDIVPRIDEPAGDTNGPLGHSSFFQAALWGTMTAAQRETELLATRQAMGCDAMSDLTSWEHHCIDYDTEFVMPAAAITEPMAVDTASLYQTLHGDDGTPQVTNQVESGACKRPPEPAAVVDILDEDTDGSADMDIGDSD